MKKAMTIFITGSTSGIGEGIAYHLFSRGYNLILSYRNKKKIKIWQKKNIDKIKMIKLDFENKKQIKEMCSKIKKSKIKFDILINNVGVYNFRKLLNLNFDDLENDFFINCFAPTMLCSSFAYQIKKNKKKGRIVNILSFATEIPSFGRSVYAASKVAFKLFTKTMAAEFAFLKTIRVNGISPGVVPTNINKSVIKKNRTKLLKSISLKKFGSVRDIANIVEFLISNKASYLNGSIIDASGGKFLIQNQEDIRSG
jgi:3-oxoacyl-[acyl-carrier protein] reductase